ncbi:MAG: TIGR04552 family protein [Polyangiales bacterium]
MSEPPLDRRFRALDDLTLADLEAVRLTLHGGSVIDWHRLNFESRQDVEDFIGVQEIQLDDPADAARTEAVKNAAISYLRRNFDFPVPKPVAQADMAKLLEIASSKGHRQLCACTILKVMHIIHHLDARELLFMLPVADQEVFHLVEEKVYRVIGGMLASGFPILEFIGGRKNKDSLYTKLLSKRETIAAQIFDKLRFRIVTRTSEDIWPTLNYLMRKVFPFNYVIPGQSTNSMFDFKSYCEGNPHLSELMPRLQLSAEFERQHSEEENRFSAQNYRVVHFVADMPIRLPRTMLEQVPPSGWSLGAVIFVQAEFQVIDRETEQANELGEASHSAYKARQRQSVMRRLKLGLEEARTKEE